MSYRNEKHDSKIISMCYIGKFINYHTFTYPELIYKIDLPKTKKITN